MQGSATQHYKKIDSWQKFVLIGMLSPFQTPQACTVMGSAAQRWWEAPLCVITPVLNNMPLIKLQNIDCDISRERCRFGYTEKLCHQQWSHGTGCLKRPYSLPPFRLHDPDKGRSNLVWLTPLRKVLLVSEGMVGMLSHWTTKAALKHPQSPQFTNRDACHVYAVNVN